MPPIHRRGLLAAGSLLAASPLAATLFAATGARAQEGFPSRPVTWLVPYAPGGFGDALVRILAQRMAPGLGVPVLVDNRPGAGGQIAATYVRGQPADGHTIFYGDVGPFAINESLYRRLSYDMARDFMPLTRLLSTPSLVVVPARGGFADFPALLAAARAKRSLTFGSYGIGSGPHLWGELLRRETGGDLVHVPYRGAVPALQDLMTGRIDVMLDVIANSIAYVRDGQLRALAVTGAHRLAQLPDVPTLTELGIGAIDQQGWNGVVIKAGTPPAVARRLHAEVVRALESPEVVARYAELGMEVAPMEPEAFGAFMAQEAARWGAVARAGGITVE